MNRFALLFLLLAGQEAYSARCRLLVQEMGLPNTPRAVVDVSRIAAPKLGPTIALLNGKAFLLDDRFVEYSESGESSGPGEKLDLRIPSERGKEAIRNPVSVAIAPWDNKFIFFVVGQNGSLQSFVPHRSERRAYSATSIPKPKACNQREKLAGVKVFGFDQDTYLYVSTSRGRIFRTVLNANDGQKPDDKWELVAQNASPHFAVLGLNDFAYLDRLGSIYLQQGRQVDWLGHFEGAVSSFSAHMVPRENSMYKYPEDRLSVWMTALVNGVPGLYRWHMMSAIRKPRLIHPGSLATEVPVAVSSIDDPAGRHRERVMVLTTQARSELAQPFHVYLAAEDAWTSPQWWQEDLARPHSARHVRSIVRRDPQTDVAEVVRKKADLPIPKLVTAFLAASGVQDPQALITAYRALSFPTHQVGEMPILQINDIPLLAHVLSGTTEEALSTLENTDFFEDYRGKSPIRSKSETQPFDTRTQDFPFHARQWLVMTAVFGMTQSFPGIGGPTQMHRYWLDQVEAVPCYGEMEFWEFLNTVYERLSLQRKMGEGGQP